MYTFNEDHYFTQIKNYKNNEQYVHLHTLLLNLYLNIKGAIHKGRLQRGRGRGVTQKRTNADKGEGVVDKVDVRNNKKLFSIIYITLSTPIF